MLFYYIIVFLSIFFMPFFPFLPLLTCPMYCSYPIENGREVPDMSPLFFYKDPIGLWCIHSTTNKLFFTLTRILVQMPQHPYFQLQSADTPALSHETILCLPLFLPKERNISLCILLSFSRYLFYFCKCTLWTRHRKSSVMLLLKNDTAGFYCSILSNFWCVWLGRWDK